jgi:hypothetical protein
MAGLREHFLADAGFALQQQGDRLVEHAPRAVHRACIVGRRCPARPARRPGFAHAAGRYRRSRRACGQRGARATAAQAQPQHAAPSSQPQHAAAAAHGAPSRCAATARSSRPARIERARADVAALQAQHGQRDALAPMIQPSSDSASRPSVTVPKPSGWACRRSRRLLPWRVSNRLVLDHARGRAHQAQRVAVVAALVAGDVERAQH